MDASFLKIVKRIITDYGTVILNNQAQCKAVLSDYAIGMYKKEIRLLILVLEAGCHRKIVESQDLGITKQILVRDLQADYYLTKDAAEDSIDLLILLLRAKDGIGVVAKAADTAVITHKPAFSGRISTGSITITSEIAGMMLIDGVETGIRIKAQGTVIIENVASGVTEIAVKGDDGRILRTPQMILVRPGETVRVMVRGPMSVSDGFVSIQGGTFTMGSPLSEFKRGNDETQHPVQVSSFYLGQHVVTQKEYKAVMGTNPSTFKGMNHPVECVSWYDAIEYCNKRSEQAWLTPVYTIDKTQADPNNTSSDTIKWRVTWNQNANGYRLPTETEWEYACRAGSTTPFSTGYDITTDQANYDGNYPYNNSAKGIYREKTIAVRSFASNPWGLFDLHGNVWEWCWDWYGDYTRENQHTPPGASSGTFRVIRGGSWSSLAQDLRSANRGYDTPASRHYHHLGFRLARRSGH
ncbi:MAG: formylglycine-generating enzyme family protein [Treponema sp.]|jgi:formylglycine-generating enzyme required for sulfatase activity|nr:formylglycine-generating enzyme family protein [Treponema sp.]